jgi:uncharacterized membrane protein YgdD (TMEM256/DUF423 family)
MTLAARRLVGMAALLLALATIVGALSAHLLRERLTDDQVAILHTAVEYQFFHSLGLLAVGVLALTHGSKLLHAAGALLGIGTVLFSGSLYLLLVGAPRIVGVLTPLGGLCLITGWLLLAIMALRFRSPGAA